jgi:hypothetical protein
MTNLQVVTWPVEKLIPYARNARTHSDDQVAQIAASIVGLLAALNLRQADFHRLWQPFTVVPAIGKAS